MWLKIEGEAERIIKGILFWNHFFESFFRVSLDQEYCKLQHVELSTGCQYCKLQRLRA